ncbi:chymotrypsin family serine protease, partial [Nocardia aurea]|uniref:hypothetical protein n=1 Tax=Nocardia aurea TaxID=2144174 RepID=UPI001300797A
MTTDFRRVVHTGILSRGRPGKSMITAVSALVLALTPLVPASADPAALDTAFQPLPAFPDEVSPEAQAAAEAINALVEAFPDKYTSVSISGTDAIRVLLPTGPEFAQLSAAIRAEATRVAPGHDLSVQVEPAFRSRAHLLSAKAQVEELVFGGTYGDKVNAVGIDSVGGHVVAYATEDSDAARADLKQRFGDTVVFRQAMPAPRDIASVDPPPDDAEGQIPEEETIAKVRDRSKDSAPHYAGAGFRTWNAGHSQWKEICSSGFPVEYQGERYILTAGHCFPGASPFKRAWASAFTTPSPGPSVDYYFGAVTSTTVGGTNDKQEDGTQDKYGDFALLHGSSYANAVYNCPNSQGACTYLLVGAVDWKDPV